MWKGKERDQEERDSGMSKATEAEEKRGKGCSLEACLEGRNREKGRETEERGGGGQGRK